MSKIEITIDGKKVEAEEKSMIIEIADQVGIYIPRFCYHKKLSIAANCRMCLVEVEGSRKPLPACASGHTRSSMTSYLTVTSARRDFTLMWSQPLCARTAR